MAFQQGLSGLASSSRALDVISSNVANSSTVGFKASNALFADTFASAMGGGVSNLQVGMGANTIAVRQSFSQGATTTTNNPLDMAIGGNGFFLIERNNGTPAYSRNGQFNLDKDGYIVTPQGERLMGYQTENVDGSVSFVGSTTPASIRVPPTGIGAKATTDLAVRANLDSALVVPVDGTFSPTNPDSYSYTTSAAVYDTLGNQHSLSMFFVKDAAPNTWKVFRTFDGTALTPDTSAPASYASVADIVFNSGTGSFDVVATGAANPIAVSILAAELGTGADPLSFSLNLNKMTQRATDSAVYETIQDGSPPGELASISVSAGGVVQGRYTNGETRDLGKVILASFRNPNGLVSLGDNLWAATIESGQAALAGPGEGLNGTIGSGRVEESNVDMSQELVNMIIQQRNYQANAQSIKTQDQILQTLINLR